ncbi:hypothetical protein L0M19_35765, partial [Streptomyces indiaensis]|nr:hypothetical protein [Streptomyces indiaensis]
ARPPDPTPTAGPAPARPTPRRTPVTSRPAARPVTTTPASPAPAPRATAAPGPSAAPVHYPRYRAAPPRPRRANGTVSPLTFVLLVTVPAVVAVAALRAR